MKEIIEILNEIKPGIDYANEKNLITNEILTSFDIVMLISLLNNKFNVNITPIELVPENFENVEAIEKLINNLKKF